MFNAFNIISDVLGVGFEDTQGADFWETKAGENGNIIIDEVHIARKTEIVPHAAPSSGQGPKPGRILLSEGLTHNEYYYEFKEFADLLENGKTESSVNSLDTSLTVLEIIDQLLAQ